MTRRYSHLWIISSNLYHMKSKTFWRSLLLAYLYFLIEYRKKLRLLNQYVFFALLATSSLQTKCAIYWNHSAAHYEFYFPTFHVYVRAPFRRKGTSKTVNRLITIASEYRNCCCSTLVPFSSPIFFFSLILNTRRCAHR